MYLNIYALPGFVSALILTFVAIIVYRDNPKNERNRAFVIFAFFMNIFSISEGFIRSANNLEIALTIGYIGYVGVFFTPVSLLYLTYLIPKKQTNILKKRLTLNHGILIIYFIGIIVYSFFIFNTSINDILLTDWGYRLTFKLDTILPGLFYVIIVIWISKNIIINYKLSKTKEEKKQLSYFGLGFLISAPVVILTNVVAPILGVYIYPSATIGIVIFSIFVALSVLKYDLFIYKPMSKILISPDEISQLNQVELKKEVEARTAALMKINKQLEKEIIEHKNTEKNLYHTIEEKEILIREKEILLKELHHRVKNNLQIISSLMFLQKNKSKENELSTIVDDINSRIISMSLIHENIYKSDQFDRIDVNKYIHSMIQELSNLYKNLIEKIQINIMIEDVFLPIDKSILFGLIINELLINAIKHGFPGSTQGEVSIDVTVTDNTCYLLFSDNGIGIPKDFDINRVDSLGLQLVKNLVNQLGGTIEIHHSKPTQFQIKFPL